MKLTNNERKQFLCNAMHDAFTPRFDAVKEQLTAWAREQVAVQHPAFVKLRANKEYREYVATSSDTSVAALRGTYNVSLRAPYGLRINCEINKDELYSSWTNRDGGYRDIKASADHPQYAKCDFSLADDSPIVKELDAAWADLFEAIDIGRRLIYSYSTREKLEADFPHLIKYLPPKPSVVRALLVPVADFTAKLTALGIPPAKEPA